ncbi:acyl carrier protein [Thalassococcus sp. BH17M4-6]|uniref:acyl carrier protein n=1 Tax=Thalassococcus sp. BH17M4-6 TaxID=3413148 RepID=UPI003BDB98BA
MGNTTISDDWIKDRIAELVAYPVDKIDDDTRLRDDVGLDSSDMMFIQLGIEKEIGAPLQYDDELQIHTFRDLMNAIEQTLLQPV